MKNDELFIDGEIPKRLSNKETVELLNRMRQGDMEARKELISGNIDLVIQCVKNNFNDVCCDKRELVAVGCLGLIKGIDNFDMLKHKYFSTHIGHYIHIQIDLFVRKLNKDNSVIGFDYLIKNGIRLKDVLLDEIDIEERYENDDYDNYMINLLQQSMEYLTERSKKIVMLYFGFFDNKRYTCEEIGSIVGLSSPRVYRVLMKSLEKLKENALRLEDGLDPVKEELYRKKTIYELLGDYTKEQVNELIRKLPDRDKRLINLMYGDDLDNPISTIGYKDKHDFYSYLIPKMRKLLQGKGNINSDAKKLSTIYELLSNYTREEIDEVIEELSDKDRELLRLRYGNDLDNPVSTIDYEQRNKFYGVLIPKMRRLLKQ